ncbi:hypothetical protein P22_3771 [Propionispora sp. 2/2-37]|uniref:XTP/dITP diphosphatase n=1 Tax=Propionispora sp. 2/2-37 TaxID=1677858 RepID=UPI0006BB6EAA|nr:XTP/dITP diphosphatase [Propionispora sp. 2/2-37]CUH97639.1 hypothetical protein P22_3771 [Propionispora sp. 2/2-37]
MKEVVIASYNKGKVAEFKSALEALPVKVLSLEDFVNIPEAEETGCTFAENAIAKARHYVKYTQRACLADDSGLEVAALQGAPGVYSARYAGRGATDEKNNEKLLLDMQGKEGEERKARFCCVLAFLDTDNTLLTAEGFCKGLLLKEKRGSGGFGYDPLFFVLALNKTLSEISLAEKNKISHRGMAIKQMTKKLAGYIP